MRLADVVGEVLYRSCRAIVKSLRLQRTTDNRARWIQPEGSGPMDKRAASSLESRHVCSQGCSSTH